MQPHEEQIWQLAEPMLASAGMELVQVECLKMKSRWLVRIYMDRQEGGVTLDDCALISNQLGDLLDVHDGKLVAALQDAAGGHRPRSKAPQPPPA